MKFSQLISLVLIFILILSTGCQAQSGSSNSLKYPSALPLPKSVTEATLVNFRPLTDSGRAIGAAWSLDGRSLAYTSLSFAPRLISFRDSDAQPQTQVWQTSSDEKNGKMLDIGTSFFYGKDGSEIFYQIYNPADGSPSIYAIDPATMKTRHFLGTQGYPSVHQLKDGRLVLSEVGNYEPLHFFNPVNGELTTAMQEHPSNAPQDARISPDGKWMAYPDNRAVYLSGWDGSSPKLLSDYGGGAAKVWWSPNSKYLAYTTGSTSTDQLLLTEVPFRTDRKGNTKTTLISGIGQVGYIASVEWSPDSRWMLVIAESANQFEGPTRTYLFDREGNHTLILEAYLSASPAWSPDGHTLAFPLWIDPQGDEPVFDIWLAELTDSKTAATMPLVAPPGPEPTPTLVRVHPNDTPDQVIVRFWDFVNQEEYHAAWSMLSKTGRFTLKYPEFRAFYECFEKVTIENPQFIEGDEDSQVFALTLDYQSDPACNSQWKQSDQIYVILVKPTAADPWQIECLSDTPACTYE